MQITSRIRNRLSNFFKYVSIEWLLIVFYIALSVISPILSAGNDILVFGMPVMAGSILGLFTISALSIIQSNFGKQQAKQTVVNGVLARALSLIFALWVISLPSVKPMTAVSKIIFGGAWITIGNMVSKLTGSLCAEIPIFAKAKAKFNKFSVSFITSTFAEHVVAALVMLPFTYLAKPETMQTWGAVGSRLAGQGLVRFAGLLLFMPVVSLLNKLISKAMEKNNARTNTLKDSNV